MKIAILLGLSACLVLLSPAPAAGPVSIPAAGPDCLVAQAGLTCPKCRKANPMDAKFCTYCGTRLPKPPPPPPPPPPEPRPVPPPPPPPAPAPKPPTPPPLPPPPPPEGWTMIGSAPGGGDATEFRVDRPVSACRLFCRDGIVIINTLVVRRGGDKQFIPVQARLNTGETTEVPISGPPHVTGFRISHEGRGIFDVYVK